MQLEGTVLFAHAIESFRVKSLTANGPKHVGEMLLHVRNLCLDCQLNIIQARAWTTIRSHAGEYPAAAFLIHQTACAIDRIHDDAPNNIRLWCSTRQCDLAITQAFRDE